MNKKIISTLTLLLAIFTLSACSSKQTTDKKESDKYEIVSNTTMIKDYNKITDSYAAVINSYADSVRDNKLKTQGSSKKAINLINKVNAKLTKNTVNKGVSNDFINMNNAWIEVIACYRDNDFKDLKTKQDTFNKAENKFRKDLNITSGNDNLTKAINQLKNVDRDRPKFKDE